MKGWGARATIVASIVGVFAAMVMIGSGPNPTAGAPPMMMPAMTNLSGQQLYTLACASCHGTTAYGRVFTMEGQTVKTPAIRYAALAKMYTKNFDEQARTAIVKGLDEEGKPLNPMMPRWTTLSPMDVNKIIAYLKTLK